MDGFELEKDKCNLKVIYETLSYFYYLTHLPRYVGTYQITTFVYNQQNYFIINKNKN